MPFAVFSVTTHAPFQAHCTHRQQAKPTNLTILRTPVIGISKPVADSSAVMYRFTFSTLYVIWERRGMRGSGRRRGRREEERRMNKDRGQRACWKNIYFRLH